MRARSARLGAAENWRPALSFAYASCMADRGFARLTPEERAAMGRQGGLAAGERRNRFTPETASEASKRAHARGTAHRWTPEEARAAGQKGGAAPHRRRGPAPATGAEAAAIDDLALAAAIDDLEAEGRI